MESTKSSGLTLPALLSVPQAARALAVSESSVRGWIRAGSLPAERIGPTGSRFRVHLSDLARLRERVEPDR